VRPVWLEAGGGVGIQGLIVIEPEAVEGAVDRGRNEAREVAIGLSLQLDGIVMAAVLEDDRSPAVAGRPYTDMEHRVGQELRSDRQSAGAGQGVVGTL
jgi:hypothetical protein